MALLAIRSAPGTTITTTSETLATNIPATPYQPSGLTQAITVSGTVTVTTGATVTSLTVKLRLGNNNTTTAQVDTSQTYAAGASGSFTASFEFADLSPADLNQGYSVTVTQNGATGNGTITDVEINVDQAVP